jgi:hypothetical protein
MWYYTAVKSTVMGSKRQLIIFLTFLIGIILIMTLIFGHGSKNSPKKAQSNTQSVNLNDYADINSKVVLTDDGRINGDDIHRSVRFTITPAERTIELVQGYEGNVIKTERFPNNSKAYDNFMRALARSGYGQVRPGVATDERGLCPMGQRYIYEVYDEDNTRVSRTWGTSCAKGTSVASSGSVLILFQAQFADYPAFMSGVNL